MVRHLEAYLADLENEAQAVREMIADLKGDKGPQAT